MATDDTPVAADSPLSVTTGSALAARPVRLSESAMSYVADAKAEGTVRAYRSDWSDFETWCGEHDLQSVPASPETVAEYLTDRADQGLRPSTLQRRLSAIAFAHDTAGHHSPTRHAAVRQVIAGVRRRHGTAPEAKRALRVEELKEMVDNCDGSSLLGARNRALLLLGFAGAFRRSELVALDRRDLDVVPEGIVVTIRRSKTDQEGEGRQVAIERASAADYDPVEAVLRWVEMAGISEGPVFRPVDRHGNVRDGRLTAQSVALVVKRMAEAAGLDPAQVSGHSLRSGLATSAARAGKSERSIMRTTGHRSLETVRRYIQEGDLFSDTAASGLL